MAQAVASKFSVLVVEDEEEWKTPGGGSRGERGAKRQQQQQQHGDGQQPSKHVPGKGGDSAAAKNKKVQKKKEAKIEIEQLKSLAFGVSKKPKGKGGNAGQKPTTEEQWQEWKKRDMEFVTETYEQDMQQAILLSKLDYEEKKDFYDQMKKTTDEGNSKSREKKKKEKKNKSQPMSLEQFNNLLPSQIDSHESTPSLETSEKSTKNNKSSPVAEKDTEFFDRITEDAKKAIKKENEREATKRREKFIPELIKISKYEDDLKAKDIEIGELQKEVEKLKGDLHNVKTRNKKLCNILAQGEMRDKAEVLVEMERLRKVKDELTDEVSSLSGQLEQERSKVSSLTSELKKNQGKKKNNTTSD